MPLLKHRHDLPITDPFGVIASVANGCWIEYCDGYVRLNFWAAFSSGPKEVPQERRIINRVEMVCLDYRDFEREVIGAPKLLS